MTKVVLFVPGIMGSVLELNGQVIWPGPIHSLFLPFGNMPALLDPNLVATDVIRNYAISEQYASIIRDLELCGFKENEDRLVIVPYDWRKDNALAAGVLAKAIDDAVDRHGIGSTEITLVAHSMGGLVSRHYLESGKYTGRKGFMSVRTLITMGTPHRGAAVAVRLVLGYERQVFLDASQVLQAAKDVRYPAPYQLFPPPGEPIAWTDKSGARLDTLDVYDPPIASSLGLVSQSLAAARDFWSTLDIAKRPQHVRYFTFTGTRQATGTRVLLRDTGDGGLRPDLVAEDDGGDGTVPTWSGFLPGIQRQFVGGEHATIYRTYALRNSLSALLGVPGTLAGVPAGVEVAIRDRVVAPGSRVRLIIGFPRPLGNFSGVLTIERANLNPDGTASSYSPVSSMPVSYQGVAAETMSLVIDAPPNPGLYLVAFRNAPNADPSGSDELFVQL
jgi:phospholipase A1